MQKKDAKRYATKDAKNKMQKEMQKKAMQQKVCIRKDPEMAQNCQHIFMTLGH